MFLRMKLGRYRVKPREGEIAPFEGGSVAGPAAAWSQSRRPKFDFLKFSADGIRLLSPSVHLTAAVRGIAGCTRRGRLCMPD